MEAVVARPELLALGAVHGRLPRGFVGRDRVLPHSRREKDVRRHVQGVHRRRGDRRIHARRAHPEGRVHRVVVAVDQVVRGARMLRVPREDVLDHRRGPDVRRDVPAVFAGPQNRQPVERGRVEVVRIALVQALHCLRVGAVAVGLLAVRVELLDRGQIHLLALGRRLRQPPGLRGREALERLARGVAVALLPERVVVRHGLAPVRHREPRIRRLCLAEFLGGVGVLEAVEQQDPPQKGGLRRGRAGRRELGPPERGLLAGGHRRRHGERRRREAEEEARGPGDARGLHGSSPRFSELSSSPGILPSARAGHSGA